MNRKAALLLALSWSTPALAWNHLGHVWLYEDMPVQYTVTPVEGYSGFTAEELVQIQVRGFQAWNDGAPCAAFRSELIGVLDPNEQDDKGEFINNTGFKGDKLSRITFDDPGSDLAEASTLAAALTRRSNGEGRLVNGTPFDAATESDIVFNNNIQFASDEQIASGNCQGLISIQATATHEIGHLMGMGHSCEQGEFCDEALERAATMFWTTSGCDVAQSVINADDIAGINALYGPFANFKCSNELDPEAENTLAFGVVPFELQCGIITDTKEEVISASWSWGDGTTSTEIDGTHTYEEAGNYTINACFEGENDTCGVWEYCFQKSSYVRACGLAEPVFTTEPVEGFSWRLRNETDLSVYGCVYDVQWDIFEGTDVSGEPIVSLATWEPTYEFPGGGTFTAVLNVGGPAGTAAAKLTFDVYNAGQQGDCSHVPAGSGMGLLALAGLLATGRRRRR